MTKGEQIFVVSGTYAEFEEFSKRHANKIYNEVATCHPYNPELWYDRVWVYVESAEDLCRRAQGAVHGWYVGTYKKRKDIKEIMQTIEVLNENCSVQ